MFSFDTPESPFGLYTSLTTWQSFGSNFVSKDYEKHKNPLYLKQVWKRVRVEQKEDVNMGEKSDPSKMAIGVEGGFDIDSKPYERHVTNYLVVFPSQQEIKLPNDDIPTVVTMTVDAILKHDGVERATQVAAAWEEEDRKESKYAKELPQLPNGKKISPDPKQWRCEESGETENLWLNLSTGHIGSGRQHWGGVGGTGAALRHYEETGRKYPLVVKLGTITPQGADVYSYASDEDDMVIDPYLSDHLAHWGINMQRQKKTEKTMTEMEIDLNKSHAWSRITESGSDLVPLHGPGYVGLENLGNSCYMASVLQMMFSIPEVEHRFKDHAQTLFDSAPEDPTGDLLAMMAKIAVGLLSDRYSKPIPLYEKDPEVADGLRLSSTTSEHYGSVKPFMFKTLVGKGHSEFSTSRQQDASEFFQHLLDKLSRAERTGKARLQSDSDAAESFVHTSALFGFELEDRIEEFQTKKVRYITRYDNLLSLEIDVSAAVNKDQFEEFEEQRKKKQRLDEDVEPVTLQIPLSACIDLYSRNELVEHFRNPETGEQGTAIKRTRFKTFPEYLAIHLKRYYLAEDWTPKKLEVSVPMPDDLDLSHLRGTGLADGETLMPEDPSEETAERTQVTIPDPGIVSQLMSMGFSENGSKRAAIATNNESAEASMEWVFAHMGDPDFNDPPITETIANGDTNTAAASEFPAESVSTLSAMGFNEAQARAALRATGGSLERAADWLFSHADDLDAAVNEVEAESNGAESNNGEANGKNFIDGEPKYELLGFASHLGSSTASGHYVAHIKKDSRFVLFNDEKVAISQNPPSDLGFLYIYRRKKN
ncbi:Ubiquitinyl hydrolase [Gracilaria domingensis]|nr:Ubiquitinyl hydrolase [Gracilaria domingensis]